MALAPDPNVPSEMQKGYPKEIMIDGECDEKFVCNFCDKILREPVQSYCGHRFCRSCVESLIRSGQEWRCTQCLSESQGQDDDSEDFSLIDKNKIFPDNAIKRELGRKNVSCKNKGCNWNGLFKEYEVEVKETGTVAEGNAGVGHIVEMTEPPQKLDPNYGYIIQCVHIDRCSVHSVILKCCLLPLRTKQWYLALAEAHAEMSHYTTECVKRKVFCDNCGNEVVHEELQNHRSTCKGQMVDCPVSGCTTGLIEHSQLMQHFKQPNHFSWMIVQLTILQQQIEQVKVHIHQSYETLDSNLRANCTNMEHKIAALQRQVPELMAKTDSSSMAISHSASQQQGSELMVRTDYSSLVVSDSALDLKIRQSVERQTESIHERMNIKVGTFEGIVSALHRDLDKAITAIDKLEHQRREMKENLDQNVAKIQLLERNLALKDISLAEMDLKVKAMETATFDGVLIWKITDFSKKQSEAQQGRSISVYSPPFYSSRHGYKMCARMYPNGDGMGKGSHLSVFFVVMRGNYDALQKWPLAQRVSFCLLNQSGLEQVIDSFRPDSQSSSFQRPTTDMNIASGCPLFIRLEVLVNPTNGFLKDDTLFLKVTVDTSDLVDPTHMVDSKAKP